MHRWTIVLAAAALSCGGGQTTGAGAGMATGGVTEPTHKNIESIEDVAREAKAPLQALILGTDDKGGSTVIPLTGDTATVTVDVLWFKPGMPGHPHSEGGTTPVALTSAPQDDGKVRVGMYEQFAGGLGPQWRAAVWMSSFLSSSILGKDLTDFRFTAEAGGFIDGPSAGALMTAGFLAAITGAEVDPNTTMTGTINPDGTIGPVGGIPQKFLGSISQGKKKLGYPVGLRMSADANTGQMRDLSRLARENGAEAVEIRDIYGAYELLTGKTLPVPVPVSANAMNIEPEVEEAFEKYYEEWQAILSEEWARLLQLDSEQRLPPELVSIALRADRAAKEAEKLRSEGLYVSAYHRIIEAVVYAVTSTGTYDIVESVTAGNVPVAQQRLAALEQLAQHTEQALRQVGGLEPTTMGDHLRMISGFQSAITGWGFHVFGSQQLLQASAAVGQLGNLPPEELATPHTASRVVQVSAPAVLAIARALAHTLKSIQALEIEGVKSLNYMCSLPNVRRLATSYSSAAGANLRYFESLFIEEISNQLDVSANSARNLLMSRAPDYLVAKMAFALPQMAGLPEQLKDEWGETSLPWGLGSLAGSTLSYFKTSILISKWYSLQVETDPITGLPTGVGHKKAFINMMSSAERKSREHARAARVATGDIPIQARIAYQHARVLREGDLADKLQALELYWKSSVYSQTAVMLSRN